MIEPSGSGTARDQAPGREFWLVIGYAAILGAVGAVGGLVFLGVIGVGPTWYGDDAGTGWMQGQLWWVAVAAAAGLLVGALRRLFAMPAHLPGLIDDLETGQMDTAMVPKTIAVSAVSLIGGASLGPEVALGSIGGGTGSWIAKRRKLASEDGQALTLSGMAGSYSGLFSSPLLSMMLVLEVARPPRAHYAKTFYGTLMSSAVGFGLYFALAGSVFLGIYEVPKYTFESWHLLVGVALGILAAVLVLLMKIIGTAVGQLVARVTLPEIALPLLGGIVFGLLGVALPLTLFTGSDQLSTVLADTGTLSTWLLVGTLLGKMVAFAVSSATRFIGGPIFPILFIGGISGSLVGQLIPAIPLALAFTCLLAAVPGSIVPAPFTMVLLAALMTQVGTLQTAPILLAVGTSFLVLSGLELILAQRRQPGGQVAASP
ncbi:MAG: chloride channel protein [Candidatus Nanopelagicales bacterium]